jgi:hypothetical protein
MEDGGMNRQWQGFRMPEILVELFHRMNKIPARRPVPIYHSSNKTEKFGLPSSSPRQTSVMRRDK